VSKRFLEREPSNADYGNRITRSKGRSRFYATINNSDFIATVLFCVIGLVVTLVMLRIPNVGAIIAEYNQF
jgi:hypothetical protein